MMHWEYKTIHCGLKKEGLLGSAFLDEDDIEVSLNEYGGLGWELISLLEVRDGIIAVLKRPVPEQSTVVAGEKLEQLSGEELVPSSGPISSGTETALLSETDLRAIFADQEEHQEDEDVVEGGEAGMDVLQEDDSQSAPREEEVENGISARDIGAIRIE